MIRCLRLKLAFAAAAITSAPMPIGAVSMMLIHGRIADPSGAGKSSMLNVWAIGLASLSSTCAPHDAAGKGAGAVNAQLAFEMQGAVR